MEKTAKAALALEDGSFFTGTNFGASGTGGGELVFNTSMAGYQEVITDPSYYGQMVLFTYPLIGNYGIYPGDSESPSFNPGAVIVREYCPGPGGEGSLDGLLKKRGIIGVEGVDTRKLTLKIRRSGTLRAVVSTEVFDREKMVSAAGRVRPLSERDLVKEVSCARGRSWNESGRFRVVVIDCGVKSSILQELEKRGCRVYVVPACSDAESIIRRKPDGVVISNGPGDPRGVPYVVETVRRLLGKIPLFGICFGHQALVLALGGSVYKLKFGHHGGNHPVKDIRTGKIYITAQNHNYCMGTGQLPSETEITHMNLYDGTVEGLRHLRYPAFSVQFHPEAGPGPNDAKQLFEDFTGLMGAQPCRSAAI